MQDIRKNRIIKTFYKIIAIVTLLIGTFLMQSKQINAQEDCYETTVDNINLIELYNASDEVTAYYSELRCGGYVIVTADGKEFIEVSYTEKRYNIDDYIKYYYTGPLELFVEISDDKVQNCLTGKIFDVDSLNFEKYNGVEDQKKASSIVKTISSLPITATILESNYLKYDTYLYDHNPDGRCGAVAAAILFMYYDEHTSEKYVADEFDTSNGVSLINHLTNRFMGIGNNYRTLTNGMNAYLSSRGLGATNVTYLYGLNSSAVYDRVKIQISRGKPLIVGLTNHPTYLEHWVVGTGYRTVELSGMKFYTVCVNDGWGNSDVMINLSYIDGCVYIK